MLTELKDGLAHVAVADVTMSHLRMEFIDFMDPLILSKVMVYIRRPDMAFLWTDFLEPFETLLWIALLTCMLVLAFCLAAVHELGRRYGNAEKSGPSEYGLRDSLLVVVGIFCLQGHSRTPVSWSCRLVYLVAYFAAVVLLAAHSGALISVLTGARTQMPFTSLEELLNHDTYQLYMCKAVGFNDYLTNSSSVVWQKLGQKVESRRDEQPESPIDGFKEMCTRRDYAYFSSSDNTNIIRGVLPCEPVELGDSATSEILTLGIAKGLPYRGLFNYYIKRMRRSGLLKVLYQREWPRDVVNEARELFGVELAHVVPVFSVLGLAYLLAVVILVIERSWVST